MSERIVCSVRWFDGYLEQFEASDARFGSDLLWLRLESGQNRHIPLRQVRWFSVTPESHEKRQAPPLSASERKPGEGEGGART